MATTPPRPADAASLPFTTDAAELENRADWWEFEDPFSDLPPALLTAEQIENYARVAGLLYPCVDKHLKSTTYEIGIWGKVYWWDGNDLKTVDASEPEGVVLKPNSISFVQTDVELRLPHYIAMRFNLHIKLVHRGLLLGTGPIVDPGFRGRLLIPLHNLTSTEFRIKPGEKIIWAEFSKTLYGRHSITDGYEAVTTAEYKRFSKDKRRRTPADYFENANAGNPIVSSIAGIYQDVNRRMDRTDTKVNSYGLIGLLALLLSLSGAVWGSWSIYNNAQSIIKSYTAERDSLKARVEFLERCRSTPTRQECK